MSKELTDKTWGLQTRSFGVVWLTEQEAANAQAAYKAGAEYLEFSDMLISKGDIAGFARGERLNNVERKRQGDFECKFGYWHKRGDGCAHAAYGRMLKK